MSDVAEHSVPHRNAICAIVVTFHPDTAFEVRLSCMTTLVPYVILVDNASNLEARRLLRELASRPGVHLIENATNQGVATALNVGIALAQSKGYQWALLFDQDTLPFANLLSILLAARAADQEPGQVALIGTAAVDAHGVRQHRPTGIRSDRVNFVITSGSLLALEAYQAVGPFRDDYFIDSVDREYGFRLNCNGYRVLLATEPGMTHVCGEPLYVNFWSYRLPCSNHSPLRRYYITRNWLRVLARYGLRLPRTCLNECFALLIDTLKAICLEPNGGRKMSAVLWGAFDAARGRMGRTHPPSVGV